jgi:hypothetical protein
MIKTITTIVLLSIASHVFGQNNWSASGMASSDGLITGAGYHFTDTLSVQLLLGINYTSEKRFVLLKGNYSFLCFEKSQVYASPVLGLKNANITGLNLWFIVRL